MRTTLTSRVNRRIGIVVQRGANRLLQAGIVVALLAGVRRRDPSVIVNGGLSLAFVLVPRCLERRYAVAVHPWQRLWISTAALVHTLGVLGPYDRVWWWDHLAHTLSGAVFAAAADVIHRVSTSRATRASVPVRSRTAFIVGTTLVLGFVWELFEYAVHALGDRVGLEPLLVHYGRLDAVGDLVCDLIGAGIVISFGEGALSNVVDSIVDDT